MRRFAIIPQVILFLTAAILIGCGGGTAPSSVSQVIVTPTGLSMNSGDVAAIVATPEDSNGTPVGNVTVTFASSNTSLINVSPTGLVCAGTWDATFINCNGDDSSGNPVSGTATITASGGGITSSAVPVTIHIKVTSVVVSTPTSGSPATGGCTSVTQSLQFTAVACSSLATPHDTTGPCAPNAKNITSQAGAVTWGTIDPSIAAADPSGLVTGVNPGLTGVFASVTNDTSAPVSFKTCMPIEIRLHIQGQPTESATMTQNQALTLETDMTDENGFTQNSIATIVSSDAPVVGSVGSLNLTASSFGGAGIMASCAPPACGNGFNIPIYSNLFPITVAGTSPATTVYATSSFTPPAGNSPFLIPIDTTKSPPAVGAEVTLPGVPNSMVFSADGTIAYLGTNAGLVSFVPGSTTTTLVDPTVLGKVLAVAQDGSIVIISNAAKDPQGNVIQPIGPSQRVWAFQQVSGGSASTQQFVKPAAIAAAINGDRFRTYIATNDGSGNIYVFSPLLSMQTLNFPTGSTGNDVAVLPSGPFAFVANQDGIDVLATCNNVQQLPPKVPATNTKTIQLLQPVANANTFVAVDSTGIDVETATVKSIFQTSPPPPFNLTANNCQPSISYSNQFIDFGIGAFTARQLMVATNGSQVGVIPSGSPNVFTVALPAGTVTSVALAAGGTQAFTGGMTPDGNTIWLGVGGTNTVDEITGGADALQVATTFKKADGTAAPPDIVAVQPK